MEKNQLSRSEIIITVFIYLSIFINSFVFFKNPVEFQFGYLVYIPLLPVFIRRYGFNMNIVYVFSILLIVGIFNIVVGNNSAQLFFKVFSGLLLAYLFYDYVIQEYKYNIELLFKWYMIGCFVASLIGAFQFLSFRVGFTPGYNFGWILNKWSYSPGGNFGLRINSIFAEPTHLGAVMSAAFFVSVYNVFIKEPLYISRLQSMTIIIIYLLSFSGLGQMGILLSLVFLAINFGLVRYLIVAIPASIFLFNVLYNNVGEFRERFDSMVDLYSGGKFVLGKTHGSSFILYNNYVVATENFKQNFLFGTGIGSHPIAFEKYSVAKHIKTYGFSFNSADANSMLLRLISETGLFGVTIMLVIMIKCFVKRDEENESNHWLISNGILIMILLNLFRQGHYFLNGFPFFVLLYIYNYYDYLKFLESREITTEVQPEPKIETT